MKKPEFQSIYSEF